MKSTGRPVPPVSVYAEQLISKGYGLPLWQPEPPDSGEVRIGDVGVVDNGRFIRFFNAMHDAAHPLNRWGVPEGFVPLQIHPAVLQTSPAFLQPGPVFNSQSMSCDVSGGVDAGSFSGLGASAKYKFSCSSDRAAVVMVGGLGTQEKVLANISFRKYMEAHHQFWVNFATSVLGLVVAPKEVILVSSSVKTCQWALAACTANAMSLDLSFEVPIANLASVSFSMATFRSSPTAIDQRSGPYRGSDTTLSLRDTPPSDQCLFLAYHKCMKRFWSQKPKYTTTVDANDSHGSSDGEWRSSAPSRGDKGESPFGPFGHDGRPPQTPEPQDISGFPPPDETFQDPLDAILEYILENSDCALAVTSHDDLYTLFGDESCWPSDFREALKQGDPTVCVDEDQVGFLFFDHNVVEAPTTRRASGPNYPADGTDTSTHGTGSSPSISGSRMRAVNTDPWSKRETIAKALELAKRAVRLDATREDPQSAVSAYGQAIATLGPVLEHLTRAKSSVLASDAERRVRDASESKHKDQEISRLKNIYDTYIERMDLLCSMHNIARPDTHTS